MAQVTAQELSLRRWGTELDPEEVADNAQEVSVRNRKKRKGYNENKKALSIASSLVAQFDRADAAVDKGGDGNNRCDEGTSTPVMKKMTKAHADATGVVAGVVDYERESVACKLMVATEMVSLESMANAKHAALEAVTDNVEVLTAQVK